MKNLTLLIAFIATCFTGHATIHTIISSGLTYSPSSLTINQGDSVEFVIDVSHNAVEVDLATYNANGTTPLTGGFSVPFGGGIVPAAQIPVGDHYYVCSPHAAVGMKGSFTVVPGAANLEDTDFNIITRDCQVEINWTPTNTEEVDYYQVQFARDIQYDFINSEYIYTSYAVDGSFSHSLDLNRGSYFFRIKSTSTDGITNYSAIKSAEISCKDKAEIIIKNNPVLHGDLVIENTEIGDIITVFDALGRKVYATEGSDYITAISAEEIHNGHYFLNLNRKGKSIFSGQVLMNK